MDILVVGGHGQVALRLLKLLAADAHTARGLIRKPDQAEDLRAVGAAWMSSASTSVSSGIALAT